MTGLFQYIHSALRQLRKSAGFTARCRIDPCPANRELSASMGRTKRPLTNDHPCG
jgi:hypothetical protein